MTTPLFLLRCVQLGLSIRDLDLLTIGMVNDMYVESRNDEYKYAVVATQKDFDQFWRLFWVSFDLADCLNTVSLLYSPCAHK